NERPQVQGSERRTVDPRLERPQVQGNDRRAVDPRSNGNGNNERSAYPRRITEDPRQPSVERQQLERGNGNGNRRNDQPSVERQQLQRSNGNGSNQRSVERPQAQPQRNGDSRSNVRELYERMSRPRETRSAEPGRAPARVEPSRPRPQES